MQIPHGSPAVVESERSGGADDRPMERGTLTPIRPAREARAVPASPGESGPAQPRPEPYEELPRWAVEKDGRLLMRVWWHEGRDGGCRVAAEVHPVSLHPVEPTLREHGFRTRETAARFVDDLLHSLEVLGCAISTVTP